MASQPVRLAALIICDIFKYDSDGWKPPIQTASSASETNKLSLSATE